METYGIEDVSPELYETLSLLRPFDIDIPKSRVGPPRDGGYVLADLGATPDLMSFGISNDVRFEKAMADKGSRCFLYDHTIDAVPDDHESFRFHRIGVSGTHDEGIDVKSIKTHLDAIDGRNPMVLKIDVEGAEWDAFSTISDQDIARFDQIAGEFHWFLQLGDAGFRTKVREALDRITRHFTLFHVHANNCRPMGFVQGFPVVDVIELSFVKTSLVKPRPSTQIYPVSGDKANNLAIADHPLLFYPFLPTQAIERTALMVERICTERYSY